MRYKDINKVEDVEGEFHVAFVEGKKLISDSEYYINRAITSFLLFTVLCVIFIIFTGFNIYYAYFIVVFLIIAVVMIVLGAISRRRGKKECIRAIENTSFELIRLKTTKDKRQYKFFKPIVNDYNKIKKSIKKSTNGVKKICVKTKDKYKNLNEVRKEKKENKKNLKK